MGKSSSAAFIVLGFAMLGLILSLILQMLYDEEIIVHGAITEAAMLPALQIIIILVWVLLGIVFAALSSS